VILVILSRFGKIFSLRIQLSRVKINYNNIGRIQHDLLPGIRAERVVLCILCVSLPSGGLVRWILRYRGQSTSFRCYHLHEFLLSMVYAWWSKIIKSITKLFCVLPLKFGLQNKLLETARICDILSLILSLVINTLYFLLRKEWLLSDLISTAIIGVVLKLFKLTNLK
jgi:hypothetical protein